MTPLHPNPADRPRECEPTFTLDQEIERGRKEMGEERWQQLQREWRGEP